MLNKNYWYQFINESHKSEFESQFAQNYDFGDWIGMNPFKVIEISDDGHAIVVENQAGLKHMVTITQSEITRYFVIRHDLFWSPGFYMVEDVKGVLASSINHRFWNEVGFNTFEVVKVDESEYNSGRTIRLAYIDRAGQIMEVNHTFTEAERSYFRRVGSKMTWNRPRGGAISIEAMNVLCEEPEKDKGLLASEIDSNPFAEVEGVMMIRVEDEADRLRAIEMLTKMKWKK